MTPRILNIAIGLWLALSTFLWGHHPDQIFNGWVSGILTASVAALSLLAPGIRYLNVALGAWIFCSAWVLPTLSLATVWNNALCGAAIFLLAFVPSGAVGQGEILPRGPRRS